MPPLMKRTVLLTLLLPAMLLTACGEGEDIVVYEMTPVARFAWPNTAWRESGAQGLVWDVPAGWVATEDIAEELVADYRFKGMSEDLPGRMTVSMIPGNGGGLDANLSRWRGQFFLDVMLRQRAPLREQVSPALPFGLGTLHFVEIEGDYINRHAPTMMLVAMFTFLDNQGQPLQTWFFKLTGDRETIQRAREDFIRVVMTFRREGDPRPDLDELQRPGTGGATGPATPRTTLPATEEPPPLLRRPGGNSGSSSGGGEGSR